MRIVEPSALIMTACLIAVLCTGCASHTQSQIGEPQRVQPAQDTGIFEAEKKALVEKLMATVGPSFRLGGYSLPITKASMASEGSRVFIANAFARSLGKAINAYAEGSATSNKITVRFFEGKGSEDSKVEYSERDLWTIPRLEQELTDLYCEEGLKIEIAANSTSPAAAAQFIVSARSALSPRTIPQLRAKIVKLLNELPNSIRARLNLGTIRTVSEIVDESFTIETEPQGSHDDQWYYQSYVVISTFTNRSLPSSPIYNLNATRVVNRRKGAENYSPQNTVRQSGPDDTELLDYLVAGLDFDNRAPLKKQRTK